MEYMFLEEIFFEIGIVLVIAAVFSMIVHRFRQPLIIAYILTGIIVGPGLLALTDSSAIFDVMSEIGVAFLLFTVGLGLDWRTAKDVGGIAAATGVGQVLFSSVTGFFVAMALGFDPLTSAYIAAAFAFSSTIIIVKLLMDKEDLDSLYGRISVGFLLVQDFFAMILLLGLGSITGGASLEQVFVWTLIKAFVLVPVFWFVSTKMVPHMLGYVAKSQELLFIFSVAWCFLIAGLLVMFGFGMELGALIAGITLSSSIYYREINARIRPLRDFFLIMFFIVLGTQLGMDNLSALVVPTIVFSAFIIIGKPVIVMFIMRSLGYHPRTGFLAGTSMAQISEFSFIVIATGISVGHINESVLGLATAIGIVTITISSFFIEHNERMYERVKSALRWLEPVTSLEMEHPKRYKATDILLFGHHRTGAVLLETVRKLRRSYSIVDFDPQVIRELAEQGEPAIYGDVGDENFLDELKADRARFIISTVPDVVISLSLLTFLQSRHFSGVVIVSVHKPSDAEECYKLGATYVIVPSILSGKKFSEILAKKKIAKRSWSVVSKVLEKA